MSFDLNKKRAFSIILFESSIAFIMFFIYFLYAGLPNFAQIKMTAQLIIRDLPIPIFILIGGFFLVIGTTNIHGRKLLYKNKNILTITNDSIIYDNFLYKKIEIKKKDIDKIYTTTLNDGVFMGGRYLAIITKKPIKELKNIKFGFTGMCLAKSFGHCLYINASELNYHPEKVAFEIEKRLSISIKKKRNGLYFDSKGFMEAPNK